VNEPPDRPPTNTRRDRRQADTLYLRLTLAALLLLGGGLIYLIYGGWAFATALVCLLGGGGVILLLWALLTLIERWVRED